MKPVFPKEIERFGGWSFVLFGMMFLSFTAQGTISTWNSSDYGSSFITPPQVDATNFVNTGVWNIATASPYTTAHTLNYTNKGTMTGAVGWEFDQGPLAGGGRGWSANFFNDNNTAISAFSGSIANFTLQLVPQSHLFVSATNIVNKGVLTASADGEIVLKGKNVLLSRSVLNISPIVSVGSSVTRTNFVPDAAIYDKFWSPGSSNLFLVGGSPWNGTTIGAASFNGVKEPCNITAGVVIGPFNPQIADSTFTNVGPHLLVTTNFDLVTTITNIVYSNIVRQAVFVVYNTNTSITATNHFSPTLTATNFFHPVVVRFDMPFANFVTLTVQTNSIYLMDDFASFSNKALLANSVINPYATCNDTTFRPATVIVSRTDPFLPTGTQAFASGSFGLGPPPPDFFFNPLTFSNAVARGAAETYSAFVDNLAIEPPLTGFFADITNAPGRIRIYANDLDLSKTRLRAEAEIIIQASNLISSSGASIDCQNLSYNLGSTNGFLNITNLSSQKVVRLNGTVTEWTGLWTNYIVDVFPNFVTNSAATNAPFITEMDITNVTEVDISITVVDGSGLSDSISGGVQDLILHSTNIVMSDSMSPVKTFLLDGKSFTLLGNLTFPNWTHAIAPTLRYFTNNGSLSIFNNAHFGDDGTTNYTAFVNHGTIFSGVQTINSDYLEINNAINDALDSDFTAYCKTGIVTNSSILAYGDIQFFANSLIIDPSILSSQFGAINFTVTNLLSDAGFATGNQFGCGNGFNLFIKPALGSLLGTKITDTAYGQSEVDHVWAGSDLGTVAAGYSNNAAIGTLVLQPSSPLFEPLFYFRGAGIGNGLYVSNLDLSLLTDYANEIDIDSSLNIYFISASLNGTNGAEQFLNDQQFPSGGHLHWVQGITSLIKKENSFTQKFDLKANYNNSAGQFQLLENILPAQTNITEASTDLIHWMPIYTNVGCYSNFGPTVIPDPVATNYPSRFYRFKVLQ
jgi:hypothetical protein